MSEKRRDSKNHILRKEERRVPMGDICIDTQTHMDSEKLFIVGDWWQPTQFQPAKETICLYESK